METNKLATTILTVLWLTLLSSGADAPRPAAAQEQAAIAVLRNGSRPSRPAPTENFTGKVTVTPLFSAEGEAHASGASVTFEPGARTAWHTHPLGQTLIVTAGTGRVQHWGGPLQEIRPGDVVRIPPGVKHWHGATPTSAMTHTAIQEHQDGKVVEWMEKVSDVQYTEGVKQTMIETNPASALSTKQRGIIPIAALTAIGEPDKLKTALTDGLAAGLTVNEIKEVLIQMYAYAGFPRSLNGLQTFMALLEERRAQGIHDQMGREASPLPANLNRNEYGARVRADLLGQTEIAPPTGYQVFAPTIDTFLKEHLFADIFVRDILDYKSRELATVAVLSSLTNTTSQLRSHLNIALNVGLTEGQMREAVSLLEGRIGPSEAQSAGEVLTQVLQSRKQQGAK